MGDFQHYIGLRLCVLSVSKLKQLKFSVHFVRKSESFWKLYFAHWLIQ